MGHSRVKILKYETTYYSKNSRIGKIEIRFLCVYLEIANSILIIAVYVNDMLILGETGADSPIFQYLIFNKLCKRNIVVMIITSRKT